MMEFAGIAAALSIASHFGSPSKTTPTPEQAAVMAAANMRAALAGIDMQMNMKAAILHPDPDVSARALGRVFDIVNEEILAEINMTLQALEAKFEKDRQKAIAAWDAIAALPPGTKLNIRLPRDYVATKPDPAP